jgi:hypothetical protein
MVMCHNLMNRRFFGCIPVAGGFMMKPKVRGRLQEALIF